MLGAVEHLKRGRVFIFFTYWSFGCWLAAFAIINSLFLWLIRLKSLGNTQSFKSCSSPQLKHAFFGLQQSLKLKLHYFNINFLKHTFFSTSIHAHTYLSTLGLPGPSSGSSSSYGSALVKTWEYLFPKSKDKLANMPPAETFSFPISVLVSFFRTKTLVIVMQ